MRNAVIAVTTLALATCTLAVPATASAETPPRATATNQVMFSSTGSPQTWSVPKGVRSAYVTLIGAAGGSDSIQDDSGGVGAQLQGTLTWAAGTTDITAWVGSAGGDANGGTPGTGGWNGGAGGGTGSWSPGASLSGGGGGGATDLRIGGFLPSTRVMVAGGGGGGGGAHQGGSGQGYIAGGAGGNGGSGTASGGVFSAAPGAAAGGKNGGAGGAGGVEPSGNGQLGGAAETGTGDAGGGGGGGGWFGGGGGQAGQAGILGYAGAAGGGGGGSSYANPAMVTNATATLAGPTAQPSATIQWVDITTTSLPAMSAGTQVSQQLVATFANPASAITWQVTGGSLPSGLTLSAQGLLSGVPSRGQTYSFTLSAIAGPGALATSTVTFSGDVKSSIDPGAPTGVTATGGAGTATVTWTAPTYTGESPITKYLIGWSSNNGQSWTLWASVPASQTSYTGSLPVGTYVFQVSAVNLATTGPPSANSNAVTVTGTSGAPTNVQGVPGYESVTLTWQAPSQTGGTAVTGYFIRYSTDGGGSWAQMPNTGSTATSATIPNLTSQAGYIFEVAAINSVGTSPWSAASSIIYPVLDPGAPSDVVGTSGYQSVELTWMAPPNSPVPVTGYNVRYSDDSGATWSNPVATGSTATTFTYANLTQPVGLIFEVQATNATGVSAWSAPSAPVFAETRASPPTKVRAYPGDRQVTLTWDPPADLGGGTLTGYRVDIRESGSSQWRIHTASTGTGATRYNVTELVNGTAYEFRVAAVTNTFGVGFFSQTVTAMPFALPGRPSDVRAVADNASATISWKAPEKDNGRRVVGYRIEAATSTGWYLIVPDTKSTATTHQVTGLINGDTYLFRVAAINIGGVGEASTPSNAVTPEATPPSPPRFVNLRPGDGKIEVTWQTPVKPGADPITGYLVEVSVAGGPWSTQCETSAYSCVVTGLSSSEPYRFRVAAVSVIGTGMWSQPTDAITPGPDPARPLITGVSVSGYDATIAVASGSLGKVRLEHWNRGGYWERIKGGTVTLGRDETEKRVRAIHRGRVSPEVRVIVVRPNRAKVPVSVTIDGDRSSITGPAGVDMSWRYSASSAWTPASSPVTLRQPRPPYRWQIDVRATQGKSRETVTIEIR